MGKPNYDSGPRSTIERGEINYYNFVVTYTLWSDFLFLRVLATRSWVRLVLIDCRYKVSNCEWLFWTSSWRKHFRIRPYIECRLKLFYCIDYRFYNWLSLNRFTIIYRDCQHSCFDSSCSADIVSVLEILQTNWRWAIVHSPVLNLKRYFILKANINFLDELYYMVHESDRKYYIPVTLH